MKLTRRRCLTALALTVVALAGPAYWFYRDTRVALQYAERMSFRRMAVAKQEETGTYRFFYMTNRLPAQGAPDSEERFGNQRGQELRFGCFDTKIDPSLSLGMIIDPTDWFTNNALDILDVRDLERSIFIEDIREQVEASPQRSLLIVVHGYRNPFPTSLRMTALVGHVLDINTPVLVFDWPGDQGSGVRGYRRAQEVAQASGAELAESLKLIVGEVQPESIWLMANSMGAQVVAEAFSRLHADPEFADEETEFEDVVLTAPDVARDEFGDRFKEEISALTRDLTVYVSSNDRALLASRLVNRGRRLGESTLNPRNPNQFPEAAAIADLVEPGSERVSLVDVTPVNRTRNFHNFSLETPEFFDDLYLRLSNQTTPRSRIIYPVESPNGAVYWVLTSTR